MAQFLKKQWLLLLLLAAGICFIVIPQVVGGAGDNKSTSESEYSERSQYASELEIRIEKLILSLPGVSSADVMLTLETDEETVYAEDSTVSGESSSSNHVVIDGGSAGEEAVPLRKISPKVRGVACVCRGGGTAIRGDVTSLICAALGLSSNRVYVLVEE